MFSLLVLKELRHHLLDLRFVAVFLICALLAALSVYVGSRNYTRQLQNYTAVSESNRKTTQQWLEKGNLFEFSWVGYTWHRRPEVLSPVVYGLSGTLGQEANIQHERLPQFEASLFETDPVHALFGVLDLAFIVKFVLTLAVLLFTYDAVCGEKENGTLRLYASFPVSRSTLALAKLTGATLAVLVPFVFAFLLVATVLALSPNLGLQGQDWAHMAVLMGLFALYLAVFAAFGLFISALTHRRLTAFLGLLALWTIWLFVIPNLALRTSRTLAPAESLYSLQKQGSEIQWQIRTERRAEADAYWQPISEEEWEKLSEARRAELIEGASKIQEKWDAEYAARLDAPQKTRRNQIRAQQRLTAFLSCLSPLGPVSFASMDVARTGIVQQERLENELSAHILYLTTFIRKKQGELRDNRTLTDFASFSPQSRETLAAVLSRNIGHILNLFLLAILGFAGAYVAILRYDVR